MYALLVYIACFGVWDKWNASDYAAPYSHFRFTNIENRRGDTTPSIVGVHDFGVMRNGCHATERRVGDPVLGHGNITVTYIRPVEMNGFYFLTNSDDSSTDFDPIKFQVHGSTNQKTWDLIGSSLFRIQDDGNRKLLKGKFRTPEQRGVAVEVNMELPWAWILSSTGHVPWAVSLTVLAIRGYAHTPHPMPHSREKGGR